MKNNPVNLITEEDLKHSALMENTFLSKKDKKDERRKKAIGKEVGHNHGYAKIACTQISSSRTVWDSN